MFAALLAGVLAAPPTPAGRPLTPENWKQDARIVAVLKLIDTFDANATEGDAQTRCAVTSGSPEQLDSFGPFDVVAQTRAEARVKTDASLSRGTTRYRMAAGRLDVDYTYTLYERGGRAYFLSIAGADGGVEREISIFYGDDGQPFWSHATARRLTDARQQIIAQPGPIKESDWSPELAGDVLGVVPGLQEMTREAFDRPPLKPCAPGEADRLLQLAPGTSAAKKADKALVERFQAPPKAP